MLFDIHILLSFFIQDSGDEDSEAGEEEEDSIPRDTTEGIDKNSSSLTCMTNRMEYSCKTGSGVTREYCTNRQDNKYFARNNG